MRSFVLISDDVAAAGDSNGRIGMNPVVFGAPTLSLSANVLTGPVIAGLDMKRTTGSLRSTRFVATPEVARCFCFGVGARDDRAEKMGLVVGRDGKSLPDFFSVSVDASIAFRRSSTGGSTTLPVLADLIHKGLADLLGPVGKINVLCFSVPGGGIGVREGIFPLGASVGTFLVAE